MSPMARGVRRAGRVTAAFETSVDCADGAVVVTVRGEVDMETAPVLWDAVEQAFSAGDRLVLDLSEMTFIDSSGLGVLIRAHQLLGPHEALVIRSPNPQASRLFETAGVEALLRIEP